MKKISLKEVCTAVKGVVNVDKNLSEIFIDDISTDTRTIKNGSLFIAIKGDTFDGHDYIQKSIECGAICIISEKNIDIKNKIVIFVKSTRRALMDIAKYYKSLFPIPVVAITGSVGKTTTKDLMYSVLSQKFNVLKTKGNLNNEIGLPKTVFELDDTIEVLVVEMGMSNFGEIHNLSEIVEPDIAIITNAGDAHIENLGSQMGVFKAKMEICDFLKKDGLLIINEEIFSNNSNSIELKPFKTQSNTASNNVQANKKIIKIGMSENCDIMGFDVIENGINSIEFKAKSKDFIISAKINIPGVHMVTNGLIVIACAKELGLSDKEIIQGFASSISSNMRMQIIKNNNVGFSIISDAYNANPTSMKSSLDVLSKGLGTRYAILGDMLELGENSKVYHYEIGAYAAKLGIDVIICVGELSKQIFMGAMDNKIDSQKILNYHSQELFIKDIENIKFKKNDVVLVKASRGMKLETTIQYLQDKE